MNRTLPSLTLLLILYAPVACDLKNIAVAAGVSQGSVKATASAQAEATNQIATAVGTAIAAVVRLIEMV